jgi:glycopeptide antibiotics resistance protein
MSTKKVISIAALVIILSIIIEILFVHHHAEFWWHELIGFDAIFGLLGCLLLIVGAKTLGKEFLQRSEDYYAGGEEDHD